MKKNEKNGVFRWAWSTIGFMCAVILTATTISASPPSKKSHDWPQWLGPNRDGLSSEKGLLKSWPADGPTEIWRTKIGDGYSAISVVSDRLYTMYATGSEERLVCLNAQSGQELWRFRTDGSVWVDQWGNGPRSTPTVDNNVVFVVGAKAKLYAVNAKTGKQIWGHDLVSSYDAKIPTWGVATSPLVYENLLVVDVGGKNGNGLVAFNKSTGKVEWKSKTSMPGYSAPIAVRVGGVDQILAFTGTALLSVSPATGARYWNYSWRTNYDVNAATPVFIAPDRVFISSGYGKGAAVLKINTDDGSATVDEVWKSRVMRNHFGSSILLDGHLYGFDESTLKSVDVNTQETKWAKRGLGKGSLIFADDHLIVLSDKGKLVLAEATPKDYVEKASAQVLKGRCWTVPTLAGGKLYVRNQKEMACYDISSRSSL
ncbi:PQQ-like beta-propeller repeat protein [bacterium]|nr:PQQ-like beta-propeller repeat protein [bacterium]